MESHEDERTGLKMTKTTEDDSGDDDDHAVIVSVVPDQKSL